MGIGTLFFVAGEADFSLGFSVEDFVYRSMRFVAVVTGQIGCFMFAAFPVGAVGTPTPTL